MATSQDAPLQQLESILARELGRVVVGAEASIRALVIALVARGHLLVQGVPGLGKTLLAKTLARSLGGEFKRIQGTPDLMPSDITGVHVFDESQRGFVFRPGPLFADVVLVDEINRAGPKTQSALLEAMEERQVSAERHVYPLPPDFLVLATQNPREFEGTYPLPESQLDRFMLRIDVNYPGRDAEAEILTRYGGMQTAAGQPWTASGFSSARCSSTHAPKPNAFTLPMRSRRTCWISLVLRVSTRGCRWAYRRAAHWLLSRRRASRPACVARFRNTRRCEGGRDLGNGAPSGGDAEAALEGSTDIEIVAQAARRNARSALSGTRGRAQYLPCISLSVPSL